MSENDSLNYNWDIAVLTFVIIILMFFWIYRFLFISETFKTIHYDFINNK